MAQCSDDHVAVVQHAQATVNVFELIVGVLLSADSTGNDSTGTRFDFRSQRDLATEVQVARNRRNLIEMNAHQASPFCAPIASVCETPKTFAKAAASAPVQSEVPSP